MIGSGPNFVDYQSAPSRRRVCAAFALRRPLKTKSPCLRPPDLPMIEGLDLGSAYGAAQSAGLDVGGDFFDLLWGPLGWTIAIGDVCGKGAEAAVITAFLRHTTAAYARDGSSPASVLSRVNGAMLEQDFEGRFATAILARLDFAPGGIALTIAAAGHPAALVVRAAERSAVELGGAGALLGVFSDPEIEEVTTMLEPGETPKGLQFAVTPARRGFVWRELGVALLPDTQVFRRRPPRATAPAGRALATGNPWDDCAITQGGEEATDE